MPLRPSRSVKKVSSAEEELSGVLGQNHPLLPAREVHPLDETDLLRLVGPGVVGPEEDPVWADLAYQIAGLLYGQTRRDVGGVEEDVLRRRDEVLADAGPHLPAAEVGEDDDEVWMPLCHPGEAVGGPEELRQVLGDFAGVEEEDHPPISHRLVEPVAPGVVGVETLEEGYGLHPPDAGRLEPVELLLEVFLEGVDRPEGDEAVAVGGREEEVVRRPDVFGEGRKGEDDRSFDPCLRHGAPEVGDGAQARDPHPHPPLDGGDGFWRHIVGVDVSVKVDDH